MLKVSVSIAVRGSYVSGYIIHIKLDVSVCTVYCLMKKLVGLQFMSSMSILSLKLCCVKSDKFR